MALSFRTRLVLKIVAENLHVCVCVFSFRSRLFLKIVAETVYQ
jgi:hypothetical protein